MNKREFIKVLDIILKLNYLTNLSTIKSIVKISISAPMDRGIKLFELYLIIRVTKQIRIIKAI